MVDTAAVVAYDLGTNTFRWLALGADGRELGRGRTVVGLGRGLSETGSITAERLAAAAAVLRDWRPGAGIVPATQRVAAVGTHALRAASNGDAATAMLSAALGHPITIIDAASEAAATFAGATATAGAAAEAAGAGRIGVLDIGGGSTEIAYGTPGALAGSISLPVGVVTLAGPTNEQLTTAVARARAAVDAAARSAYDEVASSMMQSFHLHSLIANCGTASALAAMHLNLTTYDRTALDGHRVPTAWVRELVATHAHWTAADWASQPGVGNERAPLIAAGLGILLSVLDATQLDVWTNCEAGLLEGIAAAALHESAKESPCST